MTITDIDRTFLRRAFDLAETALNLGDEPFGSVLVSASGEVLFEDHNRVSGGDQTQHPEFAISRWAAAHLTPAERAAATVYTSGEHCPMCAASHGWVGLGRIVYVSSGRQLAAWLHEWGVARSPVAPLAITEVVPDAVVHGPEPLFEAEHRELYRRAFVERNTDGAAGVNTDPRVGLQVDQQTDPQADLEVDQQVDPQTDQLVDPQTDGKSTS